MSREKNLGLLGGPNNATRAAIAIETSGATSDETPQDMAPAAPPAPVRVSARKLIVLMVTQPGSGFDTKATLDDENTLALLASSSLHALQQLQASHVDVVVSNQAGNEAVALLETVRYRWPEALRVLYLDEPDIEVLSGAVNRAAVHYTLRSDVGAQALKQCLHSLLSRVRPAGKPVAPERYEPLAPRSEPQERERRPDAGLWRRRYPNAAEVMAEATERTQRMDDSVAIGREPGNQAAQSSPDSGNLGTRFSRAVRGLYCVYQPIVCWSRRRVYGYEALCRSPEPTLASPGALFDLGERLDRVAEIGRAVRGKAGAPLAKQPPDRLLFINVHTKELLDETLFAPDSPLAPISTRAVVELTERAPLEDVEDVSERIAALRKLGFRIALDDIGAGYAGLNCLALVKPDIVKLDMALVRDVEQIATKQRVISMLTELCSDLRIPVVAEGVETAAERDALLALGCDLLQGDLFAKPGPGMPEPTL